MLKTLLMAAVVTAGMMVASTSSADAGWRYRANRYYAPSVRYYRPSFSTYRPYYRSYRPYYYRNYVRPYVSPYGYRTPSYYRSYRSWGYPRAGIGVSWGYW